MPPLCYDMGRSKCNPSDGPLQGEVVTFFWKIILFFKKISLAGPAPTLYKTTVSHWCISKPLQRASHGGVCRAAMWEAVPAGTTTCCSVLLPCWPSRAAVCFLCPQCFSRRGSQASLSEWTSGYLSEWCLSDSLRWPGTPNKTSRASFDHCESAVQKWWKCASPVVSDVIAKKKLDFHILMYAAIL